MEHLRLPSDDSVAAVVREAVKAAGLSDRATSRLTGIPLATLGRRLTAHSPFTMTELRAIAAVVGQPVSGLIAAAEARTTPLVPVPA